MNREETSWVLYDVANSAFVLIMVTAIMPIYFKDVIAADLPGAVSTARWGFANAAAALILAVLAPLLGAMADFPGRKKRLFALFLSFGLVLTATLLFVGPGQWLPCLLIFCGARIGWAGANIFYDAFLVDVTTKDRLDTVSARGFGLGYIGSVIPFVAVIGLILAAGAGASLPVAQTRIGFVIVILWWLLLSVPMLIWVKQRHYRDTTDARFTVGFRHLATTLATITDNRPVFFFLLAYFFYIDGVGTIITMAIAYGRDLGFSATMLIIVLLYIQIVAFPFTLVYGRLARRFGTKTMLFAGIGVYMVVSILGFSLPAAGTTLKTALFWLIATLVASSMGGIQALSRSYFGALIPSAQSGEFFGFYNVFGKFAAISGPLLMGIITAATGHSRWGMLSILVLFVIGGFFLTKVKAGEVTNPA
ncbi:MAG: MFS transporter [Desulfofustis sp. PB-SRB1]|jgi:UMF1 family MFS transporter|nr:MFS transporter [Desulfofustis sp. PB-SRB1]HBH28328.1 MFS transporter [Desulfofustis sp.]